MQVFKAIYWWNMSGDDVIYWLSIYQDTPVPCPRPPPSTPPPLADQCSCLSSNFHRLQRPVFSWMKSDARQSCISRRNVRKSICLYWFRRRAGAILLCRLRCKKRLVVCRLYWEAWLNRECAPRFNPIDGACNIGFRSA